MSTFSWERDNQSDAVNVQAREVTVFQWAMYAGCRRQAVSPAG